MAKFVRFMVGFLATMGLVCLLLLALEPTTSLRHCLFLSALCTTPVAIISFFFDHTELGVRLQEASLRAGERWGAKLGRKIVSLLEAKDG